MSGGAEAVARSCVAVVRVVDDVADARSAGSSCDRRPRGEHLQTAALAAVTAWPVVGHPAVADLAGEPAGAVDELAVVDDGAAHSGTDVEPDERPRVRGDPVACFGECRRLRAVVGLGRDRDRVRRSRTRWGRLATRGSARWCRRRSTGRRGRAWRPRRPEPGRSERRRLGARCARVVERVRPSVRARRPWSRTCGWRAPGRVRRRRQPSCGRRRCGCRGRPPCWHRSRAGSVGARPSSRRRRSRTRRRRR